MRQIHTSRFDGISKRKPFPRLDLNERDCSLSLDHEIDVAMAVPKPALQDSPALPPQPPLCDPFSQFAEFLPGR